MKENKEKCDLNSCYFCNNCLKEWLPAIEKVRKSYKVKKGELIFKEGEKVSGVYFVTAGTFKVHKKWGEDKELIVRFAKEGSIIGHRGLGTNLHYPVSATALEPATVCFIDIDFFYTSLKVNTDFAFKLLLFFADELQESERKMRNLAHMSVKGRVALALLTLQEKFGITAEGAVDIELSRQDLSSYAGATYETLFRTLNELSKVGAIQFIGKRIKIVLESLLAGYTQQTFAVNTEEPARAPVSANVVPQ